MLEKCKRGIDNGTYVSALFMDLPKVFETINHDLLLAKLKAYGFSTKALKLMHYIKNRKQKVQINNNFSLERDVIAEVPQGLLTDHYPLITLLMTLCFLFNIAY